MNGKHNNFQYSVDRLSKKLGLDKARQGAGSFPPPVIGSMQRKTPQDVAPPHMVRFAIAIKPRGGAQWPSQYQEVIDIARRRVDEGTHEMCQGHVDGFVILYLIPRKTPEKRDAFFAREWGMKK